MSVTNTQKISRLLVQAREDGLIPWEWIVDDSRRMEGDEGRFTDLEQYAHVIERSYRRDFWAHQLQRVIVISEKATVAGILRPILDEYGVPFFAAHGFDSATKVYELAQEIEGDPRSHVFFYIGDYDCSGMHMSEVDLPKRLDRYGASGFEFRRIALTDDDVGGGDVPSFPAKETDPRYHWYVGHYGRDAWELDAMEPNVLRERVEENICHLSTAKPGSITNSLEEAQRECVHAIAAKMAVGSAA